MSTTLKALAEGFYDLQKLRIQTGNRVVATFKSKLGYAPGKKEDENEDPEADEILRDLRTAQKLLATSITKKREKIAFPQDGLISDQTEFDLVALYIEMEKNEREHQKAMLRYLKTEKVWNEFLSKTKGVGEIMAMALISQIDIRKAKYPSSIWRYAGLDVAQDGKGRSRRKEHLITVPYTDKQGEQKEKQAITFNPFLKSKLYVLGTCFLRSRSPYRDIYDQYKFRLENHKVYGTDEKGMKGHRHNMAIRYMLKMFLLDLYKAWRTCENLPVAPSYHEAKLGHKHAAA